MQIVQYTPGMALPECGYVLGMPNDVYHGITTHISSSRLRKMLESPYKFYNPEPFEPTRAKDVGSAIHARVLEPDTFQSEFFMMPELESRTASEYKAASTAFGNERATSLGLTVTAKEAYALGSTRVFAGKECAQIDGMFAATRGNDDAAALLNADGWCELSGFATCPRTGLKLKIRFDKRLKDGRALDLKKTQSVHLRQISKSITDYNYHIQEAFYTYVDSLICDQELLEFAFIFVEEKFPNEAQVVELDTMSREIGKKEMNELLDMVVYYSQNSNKPTNNNKRTIVSLSEWKMRQYDDEVM